MLVLREHCRRQVIERKQRDGSDDGGSKAKRINSEAGDDRQQQRHADDPVARLDANVAVLQDRCHRVGHDPVAVVLVVEHALLSFVRTEARVVLEGHGLGIHVASVNELGSHDDDVVGDLVGVRTCRVERIHIAAGWTAAECGVNEHLAVLKRNVVLAEARRAIAELDWVRVLLRDSQRLHEGAFVALVLQTAVFDLD